MHLHIKTLFLLLISLMSFFNIQIQADVYYIKPYFPNKRPENKTYYNYGKGLYSAPYNYGERYGYVSHYPYGKYDDYGPFLGVNNSNTITYRK